MDEPTIELPELCMVEECGNWSTTIYTIPDWVLGYFEVLGHIVEAGDPLPFCDAHAHQVISGKLQIF